MRPLPQHASNQQYDTLTDNTTTVQRTRRGEERTGDSSERRAVVERRAAQVERDREAAVEWVL